MMPDTPKPPCPRDANGRLLPGAINNPKGGNAAQFRERCLAILVAQSPDDKITELFKKVWIKALSGDEFSINLLVPRLLGQPENYHSIEGLLPEGIRVIFKLKESKDDKSTADPKPSDAQSTPTPDK